MGVRLRPFTGPRKPIKYEPQPEGPKTQAPTPQPGDLRPKSGGWSG